jgi:predicted transcriptional regulator
MSDEIEVPDNDRIDAIIWRYSDVKSTKEIAKLTGLTPAQVHQRKREMYETTDELSIQMERQRLITELRGMSRDARDRAEKASDEFYAGTLNAAVGAIKAMLVELARMEKQDSSKVDALNQLRVKELVNLIQEVVDVSVNEISEKHGIDADEMFKVFNRRMVEAAQKRDMQ